MTWLKDNSRVGRRLVVVALIALMTVLAVFSPVTAQQRVTDVRPATSVAQLEQEFLMGMIPHHRSAVMMAEMAVQKATKPQLRELAQRIIDTQQEEIHLMTNYLRDWYGMQPPADMMMTEEMMRRMDMPMMNGTMPSMQSMMMQMDMLRTKTGADFDIAFISAMSEHHAMATMMASTIVISGQHADLYKLASMIIKDQGEEIEQMRMWLMDWYGVDRPIRMR